MSQNIEPTTVKILGKEYVIGCPAGEEDALAAAARYVDQKMQEIKSSGRGVVSSDRAAVMAALNIANELFAQHSGGNSGNDEAVKTRINALSERIALHLHD